jgi:hypothetical protein
MFLNPFADANGTDFTAGAYLALQVMATASDQESRSSVALAASLLS